MDWAGYQIYDPGIDVAREDASRREAEAAFNKLMDEKDDRIRMLFDLTARNGMIVDNSDAGIDRLEQWFRDNLTEGEEPGRLELRWYSIVNDTGLFLGDVMIARNGALSWGLSVRGGASSIHYQRPVIRGFTRSADPELCIDPDLDVASYAHALAEGECAPFGAFRELIDYAAENG